VHLSSLVPYGRLTRLHDRRIFSRCAVLSSCLEIASAALSSEESVAKDIHRAGDSVPSIAKSTCNESLGAGTLWYKVKMSEKGMTAAAAVGRFSIPRHFVSQRTRR
jgi:hypothetical protein